MLPQPCSPCGLPGLHTSRVACREVGVTRETRSRGRCLPKGSASSEPPGPAMLTHDCHPRVTGACSLGLLRAGCGSGGSSTWPPGPRAQSRGGRDPAWHMGKFKDRPPGAQPLARVSLPRQACLWPRSRDAALWVLRAHGGLPSVKFSYLEEGNNSTCKNFTQLILLFFPNKG